MRANLQVIQELLCAEVVLLPEGDVAVQRVVLSYNMVDTDLTCFRCPHDDIITHVDVATAVKLIALLSKFELQHPESFQHLQNMDHITQVKRDPWMRLFLRFFQDVRM